MTGSRTAERNRPRSHSIQNALVAAAILAEFVLIIGHPLFGWGATTYAATPRPLVYNAPQPPSGRQVLLALSAAAARQRSELATARTPYTYVRRQEWHLAAHKGDQSLPSKVLPTVTESWLKSDGGGRVLSTTRKPNGSTVNDVVIPAGQSLPVLSASPATLAHRFGLGYPGTVPSARQFVAFTSIADTQPISPRLEAAILRLLALTPGVTNSGTVSDRDGRRGVAVSAESDYTGVEISYTLVFDQSTGKLLEADQTLTGDPGNLGVPQGSVLAYTTYLGSGYTGNATSAPPG
ncbi:MAG: CU044_5270 family protein [Actinomycetota bacterium]|nr:CU044_5270 family protein [Actinomycetota bacterium]